MTKRLRLIVRVLEQSISVIALLLFALTLLGVRWFVARPSAIGLGVAVGAGAACLVIVGAMIYLHYPSPRRRGRNHSEPHSC
jgi:uncharacterized membrane protein